MDNNLKRKENESDFEYKVRICLMKLDRVINLEWDEISELVDAGCSGTHLRKLSYAYREMEEFKKEHPYTARMALAQIIIDHANTIALACQTSKVFEIYLELTATLLSRDLGYNLNAKKGDPDHIASVLQTTEKTIVGAINEVNKKVDDLLIDISQQIASAIAEHDADENAHFSLFQRVKQIWESV